MAGIFKAYDIRGIYGEQLTDDLAYKIGRAYATFLQCKKVVVGYDMRPHSANLFKALARGLTEQGADVINIGLCSTPMTYFANGSLHADGGIMITASHNTGEWNGFKLCRQNAIPISGATGIADIEKIVHNQSYSPAPAQKGQIKPYEILPAYRAHIRQFSQITHPVKIAVDYANAMGIYEAKTIEGLVTLDPLYDTLDGTFPHHEANPLKTETMADLQAKVRNGHYDFGIAFDGDADRVGFVDEHGEIVSMDLITALIAAYLLEKHPGETIYYDLRSSAAVRETIVQHGGRALESRVGHAFIKQQMRDAGAIFAGELSGHYYFRDNYFTECSALAVVYVSCLLCQTGKTLSNLVAPLRRYYATGEINSVVKNPAAVFQTLRSHYSKGKVSELDGLSIAHANWWFNVRLSNTEPLIRLNLEADTEALMRQKRDEVLELIRR